MQEKTSANSNKRSGKKKIGGKSPHKEIKEGKKAGKCKKSPQSKKQEGKKRENPQKEPISKIVNGENKKVTTNNH